MHEWQGEPSGRPADGTASTAGGEVDAGLAHRNQAILCAFQGRNADSEFHAREALRLRPHDIDVMNELGASVWRQGRAAEAEEIYREACRIKPDDFRILTNLGLALASQGRPDEAAECYRAALAIQPDIYDARMNLGNALCDQGKFEEADYWLNSALELRPNSPDALQNVALNLTRQGRWREAIPYYERALRQRPNSAELRRDFAYALLAEGDFERGWPEHEARLSCQPHRGCRINRTFWNGDDFRGRTILLHFEQGFGDTLQFVRFAPLVKRRGGQVTLLCQGPLVRLLARCQGLDLVCDGSRFEPECHIQAPLMSLPAILGTTLSSLPNQVPYLAADAVLVAHWRAELERVLAVSLDAGAASPELAAGPRVAGRPFLIGVAWQGSPDNGADHLRSFPLGALAPVAELPGVRLVNLQVGHGVDQLRSLGGRFPLIELPGRRGREFSETAAIMCLLDLVIAPCTAVTHLAGGLGMRTWTALCYSADWRWMAGRDHCPWYPTMRLFRQNKPGDWAGVFAAMAEALGPELERRPAVEGLRVRQGRPPHAA
jgi:Flp pilus assembly protein TadD